MLFSLNKQAVRPTREDPGWLAHMPQEAALLACVGLALLLIVSLFSFHATDVSWSTSGAGGPVQNLAGSAGAWLSDALFSAFGYVAFLVPWVVLWIGLRLFRGTAGASGPLPAALRGAAWLVGLLALCALGALFTGATSWLPQGAGGIAGAWIGDFLRQELHVVGAALVLLTALAIALPVALVFSWPVVLDRLGGWVMAAYLQLRRGMQRWLERYADKRAAGPRVERTTAEVGHASRRAPTIGLDDEAFAVLAPRPPEPTLRAEPAVHVAAPARPAPKASRAKAKAREQVPAFNGDPLPPLELLDEARSGGQRYSAEEVEHLSRQVEQVLADFGVHVQVQDALPG
ncbi:MAG TPA: DNA translocase FtsK 4TM domain-containing protein, partial [Nevskiaceae bacterium]|nr:DNA translocase FtsK 4TM domain-containing protein [Nevskiaceae bacterium]